ncbi:DEAD/DEAH box helicase family protein [Streptomyces sp. CA-132043]|uniref:DEAD/DEAH box helicase family protein n=1 Tax=Streptomyces sp. CA-132043 TaxID=3240048 RepID=UPI003D8D7FF4
MPAFQLREHQVEANAHIRRWVGFPARRPVPERGARATVVSATGTGKTVMVAMAAYDHFRDGRVLVMVPTLDLLVQTTEVWRRVGHSGPWWRSVHWTTMRCWAGSACGRRQTPSSWPCGRVPGRRGAGDLRLAGGPRGPRKPVGPEGAWPAEAALAGGRPAR